MLIFTKTKFGAEKLGLRLRSLDMKVAIIHGDKLQRQRKRSLVKFKEKQVDILVATDIAARGLHIEQLPCVINYDIPTQPNDYIHRIGRTGRAGKKGVAISIISVEEKKWLKKIENHLKIKTRKITEYLSIVKSDKSKRKTSTRFRPQKEKKSGGPPKKKQRKSKFKKAKSPSVVTQH